MREIEANKLYAEFKSGSLDARNQLILTFVNYARQVGRDITINRSLVSYYEAEAIYLLCEIVEKSRTKDIKNITAYIKKSLKREIIAFKSQDITISISINASRKKKYILIKYEPQIETHNKIDADVFLNSLTILEKQICLFLLEGFSEEAIAEKLGYSRVWIAVTRRKLKEKFSEMFPGLRRYTRKLSQRSLARTQPT